MYELKRQMNQNKMLYPSRPIGWDGGMSKPVFDDNPLVSQHQVLGNQSMQRFAQSCPLALPSASLCPFGGVCHTCPARVQTSLKISQPGDKYEQEAERVAEEVMLMPDPSVSEQLPVTGISSTPQIQRHCPECDDELQRKIEEDENLLQTKEISGQAPKMNPDMQANINAIRSNGQPLPDSVREYFVPRFGYDFSKVRVHGDARAAESAKLVNARAFTLGTDILFGEVQYAPDTQKGKTLLAHELMHTIQQRNYFKSTSQNTQSDDIVLQRRCTDNSTEEFYRNAPNYCRDTGFTGAFHPRQRCYREVPRRTGYFECPLGDQVCFDAQGRCHDSYDKVSPVKSKNDDGTCNLHAICSIGHGAADVAPWILSEMGRPQVECIERCHQLSGMARVLCLQACSPQP